MEEISTPANFPERWPAPAAMQYINSLLQISVKHDSQDWEFEISDPDRLSEYLTIYENNLRNEDDRFALMSVIIDAFEHSSRSSEMWNRIRKHLKDEFGVHQYTIYYWCVVGENDLENYWEITPWMRELWDECRGK
jgi:hypothetical protein